MTWHNILFGKHCKKLLLFFRLAGNSKCWWKCWKVSVCVSERKFLSYFKPHTNDPLWTTRVPIRFSNLIQTNPYVPLGSPYTSKTSYKCPLWPWVLIYFQNLIQTTPKFPYSMYQRNWPLAQKYDINKKSTIFTQFLWHFVKMTYPWVGHFGIVS